MLYSMRHDKEKALELYRSGLSYGDISKKLLVSKSTLSLWFRKEQDLQSTKHQNISRRVAASIENLRKHNKKRRETLDALYSRAEYEAKNEFEQNSKNPLFIAGVCLYWGEGDKISKNGFRIANSDPRLIRLFIAFLIKFCNAEKARIRAAILMYPDMDEERTRKYWRDNIFLGKEHFTRTVRVERRNAGVIRIGNGVCTINYSSTFLKKKMLCWIDLAAKGLLI
jgi:hypothetical protein